jgi:hypothetical protein
MNRVLWAGTVMVAVVLGATAEGAVCKPDGTPVKAEELVSFKDPNTASDPLRVRVVHEGLKPLEHPRPPGNNNVEVDLPLEFLETHCCALPTIGPNRELYYLLVDLSDIRNPETNEQPVEKVLGWVDSRYLIAGTEAQKDARTKVHKKAMIINTPQTLREDLDRVRRDRDARLGAVVPRRGPNAQAMAVGEAMRLFNIFFVYGEADGFILLGRRPSFDQRDDLYGVRQVILGWVPKERVCQWMDREAVYWKPYDADPRSTRNRKVPGRTYEMPELAEKALLATNPQAVPALVIENSLPMPKGAFYGRQPVASQPRYPLLELGDLGPVAKVQQGNRLYRIGVIGGLAEVKGGQVDVVKGDLEIARIQRQLDRLQREVRRLEMLFVIDETASMIDWFPTVADTVKLIVKAVRGPGAGPELRLAVAYYGDTYGGSRPFTTAPLQDAAARAGDQIVQEVANHHGQRFPKDDAAERVFLGLGRAIDDANFSARARKLVILIGDHGNKEIAGDPKLDDLVARMVPTAQDRTPIEFYAIQVGVPVIKEAKQFRAEMQEITAKVAGKIAARYPGDPSAGRLSAFDSVSGSEEANRLIRKINDRYQALRKRALELNDEIDDLRLDFSSRLSPETERLLTNQGVPIEELRKIRGAQIFREGYVWEKNSEGIQQIRPYNFITGLELDTVLKVLNGLELQPGQAGMTTVTDLIKKVVQIVEGEYNPDKQTVSANDILAMATGIRFKSPIFGKRSGKLNLQDLEDLKKKRMILEDIKRDLQYEFVSTEEDRGGNFRVRVWRHSNRPPVNRPRGFALQGDERITWYWIDGEDEWP